MPICLVLLIFTACAKKRQEKKKQEQQQKVLALNGVVTRHHDRLIEEFQEFYGGLYIQPIDLIVDNYQDLDSLIQSGKDSILLVGSPDSDSLFFRESLNLFEFYEATWEGPLWEIVLIMERFELERIDDTYQIKPLVDSIIHKEQVLIEDWEGSLRRISDQLEMELEEE